MIAEQLQMAEGMWQSAGSLAGKHVRCSNKGSRIPVMPSGRGMAVTAKSSNRYHTVCLSFTGAGMTEICFGHVANALAGILQLVLVLAPAVSTVVGSPVGAVLPQDPRRRQRPVSHHQSSTTVTAPSPVSTVQENSSVRMEELPGSSSYG